MALDPKPGEGEEYTMGLPDLVHSDPKVLAWRTELLEQAGFNPTEAKTMARWRTCDPWQVRDWIATGKCTHATAMAICAPDLELPTLEELERYGQAA